MQGGFTITEASTPKKASIYYLEPNLLKEFAEICEREGTPRTLKIENWVRHFVQLHRKGNPQLMIETFLPKQAKPLVLCNSLDGSKEGEVHCVRKSLWIPATDCYSCDRNRLRKK